MVDLTVNKHLFFDEVTFPEEKSGGGQAVTVRAYGAKMALIVKVLNTIAWICTGGCYFKAKLVKIPDSNNYLYDTTLARHLGKTSDTINDETIKEMIKIVQGTSTKKPVAELKGLESLDVENQARARKELKAIEQAIPEHEYIEQMKYAYLERRTKFSKAFPFALVLTFTSEEKKLVGYFKDYESAHSCRYIVVGQPPLVKESVKRIRAREVSNLEELVPDSSISFKSLPLIDDPLANYYETET